LITGGCNCNREEYWKAKCQEIEKVTKDFTFEIYAKYRSNNEPIPSEGRVRVHMTLVQYTLESEDNGICEYEINNIRFNAFGEFNHNGLAIITTREFEFKNEYDKVNIKVTVHFSDSFDRDQFVNSKYITVSHESSQYTIMDFNYLSKNDL